MSSTKYTFQIDLGTDYERAAQLLNELKTDARLGHVTFVLTVAGAYLALGCTTTDFETLMFVERIVNK